MNIEVITIGNELLDGRRTDTNTTWIGHKLNQIGQKILYRQSVNDDQADIETALLTAVKRADMVITTGGLGPTLDDITFAAVASAAKQELVYHQDIFAAIELGYQNRGLVAPASNKRQAWLPSQATRIDNANGTAPGICIAIDGVDVFVFPGVPAEMQPMFDTHVLPKLRDAPVGHLRQFSLAFLGLAEAVIEEKILGDLRALELEDQVAYSVTASFPLVTFVFRIADTDAAQMEKHLKQKFFSQYSQHLWSFDEKSIEQHVILQLKDRGWKLQVAESTSGGMLASAIVDIPGCSEVFDQGLVTYSNQSKVALLGVCQQTLRDHGAVSAQCAQEMARGLLTKHGADVGVATTGIAGPSGGSDQKPVGRTYIAWAGPGFDSVKEYNFVGDRSRNRVLTTHHALLELFQKVKK